MKEEMSGWIDNIYIFIHTPISVSTSRYCFYIFLGTYKIRV